MPSPGCIHLPLHPERLINHLAVSHHCTLCFSNDVTKVVERETFPSSQCLWKCSKQLFYSFIAKKREKNTSQRDFSQSGNPKCVIINGPYFFKCNALVNYVFMYVYVRINNKLFIIMNFHLLNSVMLSNVITLFYW